MQGDQISNLYDPVYTNFSPRIGFSYQPRPNTVVRAGAGLYFDTPNLNPFLDNRPGNGAPNGVEGNPTGPGSVQTITTNSVGISARRQRLHLRHSAFSEQSLFRGAELCAIA